MHIEGLERKNGAMKIANPKREKDSCTPDVHENPDDACCWCNVMHVCKDWCSSKQTWLFCEAATTSNLCSGKCHFNANKKVAKKNFSKHIKNVAEHSAFHRAERCMGHAPRKRCHDAMALNQVPLGKFACLFVKCFFILFIN